MKKEEGKTRFRAIAPRNEGKGTGVSASNPHREFQKTGRSPEKINFTGEGGRSSEAKYPYRKEYAGEKDSAWLVVNSVFPFSVIVGSLSARQLRVIEGGKDKT